MQNNQGEKSGKRDYSPSAIYRDTDIMNGDVDKFITKYGTSKVAAVTEWKHGRIPTIELGSHQISCIRDLAGDKSFFIIVYFHYGNNGKLLDADDYPDLKDTFGIIRTIDHAEYYVVPANKAARENYFGKPEHMSQKRFWDFNHEVAETPHDKINTSGYCNIRNLQPNNLPKIKWK